MDSGRTVTGRFDVVRTSLEGLLLLERRPIVDSRGYFERLFCANDLADVMLERTIVQMNHTLTVNRGAVRGIHFQRPPHAELKVVTCLRGEVFDVAVDLRRDSPTFLSWHGEILSAQNHRSLLIPEGFGHGFQCLTDDCELLYLHTVAHVAGAEDGLDPRDVKLAIAWPEKITEMSARDSSLPQVRPAFEGIVT